MKVAFGRNVRALREHQDVTQSQLADALGVTPTTVWRWENGFSNVPKQSDVVEKLKLVFSVDDEDLFGYQDGYYAKTYGLTERPPGALAPAAPKRAYAPLLGRVHAGDAQEPDILQDRIPIPYEIWERHEHGYFLEVEGTCMSRVYTEGSYIYVDPDREPQNGSIAVVSIDGADYIMRRLLKGAQTLVLSPDSFDDSWEDIVIRQDDGHDVRFEGTVVWHQAKEELE